MVRSRNHLLLLTGAATVIAIGVVSLASGVVGAPALANRDVDVVAGLALLIFSLVVAGWYESRKRSSDSSDSPN